MNMKKLLLIPVFALLAPLMLHASDSQLAGQLKKSAAPTAKSVVMGKSGDIAKTVPAPSAAMEVEEDVAVSRGQYDFNPPCPLPRGGFSPLIEDQNRIDAINDLLGKIYNHEKLPYSHDGIVFQNKENRLPQMPYGYYHEYTLLPQGQYPFTITIGGNTYQMGQKLSKRGAERIIIGGGQEIFYTFDHYKTFVKLEVVR